MARTTTLYSILLICFSKAVAVNVNHPVVGNWDDAVNSKGLVRIPVQNPDGHSWFIAYEVGTPPQKERMCALGSNHALSVVF